MSSDPHSTIDYLRARLFRGLADPSRMSILNFLQHGEATVGEITATTGLSQPNVSNHLNYLLECGLVSRRQEGRYGFYSWADARVGQILCLADEMLAGSFEGHLPGNTQEVS